MRIKNDEQRKKEHTIFLEKLDSDYVYDKERVKAIIRFDDVFHPIHRQTRIQQIIAWLKWMLSIN